MDPTRIVLSLKAITEVDPCRHRAPIQPASLSWFEQEGCADRRQLTATAGGTNIGSAPSALRSAPSAPNHGGRGVTGVGVGRLTGSAALRCDIAFFAAEGAERSAEGAEKRFGRPSAALA